MDELKTGKDIGTVYTRRTDRVCEAVFQNIQLFRREISEEILVTVSSALKGRVDVTS